jgi:predicted alpha/beta superfamily hydrolase
VKNTYAPAIDLAGGAQQFTTFLRSELIPRIDSLYPSDPARRGLAGYSLGGLLAAYVLTTDLSFFQYYLLGSPSMWWDEYRLAFEFKSIPAERLESVRRIYMSVGAEESWEMLKGFGILRDALQEDGFKEPRARMEIIADAGHVGALPIAMYNGLRFLFRREQRLTVFGEHSLRRAARLCRLG